MSNTQQAESVSTVPGAYEVNGAAVGTVRILRRRQLRIPIIICGKRSNPISICSPGRRKPLPPVA